MSTDTDDRNTLALDLLLSSVRGRRLPEGRHATAAVSEALALADAFLAATPRTFVATLAPPPGSALALIDEIDRIFPGQPGRARELLAELRRAVELLEVGGGEGTCEGCGCAPCAATCPGRMTAPTVQVDAAAPQVTPEDAAALLDAARVLVEQNVGDYTYSVREREALGWDGPLVTAWSNASVALGQVVKKYPAPPAPPTRDLSAPCPDCREDCASWVAVGEPCRRGREGAVAPPADPTDDVLF